MAYTYPPSEPIAIIGSGCRFPGKSTSPSKLWQLLTNPVDLSKKTPSDRFEVDGFYHPDGEHHGTTNAPNSYWLEEDHRLFDAAFFNITPKEAEAIDPQQRLLLETVYEAMESAGLTLQNCSGDKVSVYVGTMTADYDGLTQRDEQYSSQYCATGTSRAIISNRISYFFNWHGPSMTIDTACSSSLVAVHQAVLSLRSGESSVSCVAGANVMLGPENFIAEASLHMLSPTGKSRMWDIDADGYARGEGVAVVFLKTLSKALADGDSIEGIIRETGVNSDGRTQGITMPSSEAQAELIRETYRKSRLDIRNPHDRCQYFEAHGTGTQAGDPREAGAISRAFFGHIDCNTDVTESEPPKLLVGSIKTVIGHTEGAAGIAGLLKVALAMKHRVIPPNQHLRVLNPTVAPFYKYLQVPNSLTPWPSVPSEQPLRSSVNSFGFGGTNAHAILERYEPRIHNRGPRSQLINDFRPLMDQPGGNTSPSIPLLLSAYSEKALVATVDNYVQYLKSNDSINLRDLAWTLSSRRSVFPYKVAFSGLSRQDLVEKMEKQLKNVKDTPSAEIGSRSKSASSPARILGIFTGQGAQWPSMGKELILSSNIFLETVERLEAFLRDCPDPPSWSLREEIMASDDESRLNEAALSQPLCTALQVALVDLLKHVGVGFSAVVGHSSGEIGAAYAAGVLTARDAILIAYYRGVHAKLAQGPNGAKGGMMATGLGIDDAMDFCEKPNLLGRVYIAASNAPASVTISGDLDAIHEAKAQLDNQKKFARMLKVDTAYHSHHMDLCADPYVRSIKACRMQPKIPEGSCAWISSVYGPVGTPSLEELAGSYWRDNMVQPVLFTEALERALKECGQFDVALEVGPHPALKGPSTQTMKEVLGSAMPYSGVLDRGKNDLTSFGDALGFLWGRLGATAVDFARYAATFENGNSTTPQIVKDLPPYPWDHSQAHYRESRLARQYLHRAARPHELLGTRTSDDSEYELRWRNILKPNESAWLKDHRFQGQIIVPAAAYCVMALDAGRALSADKPIKIVELQNIFIHSGITIDEDSQGIEILFSLTRGTTYIQPDTGEEVIEATFTLSSTPADGNRPMKKSLSGKLLVVVGEPNSNALPHRQPQKLDMNAVDLDGFYSQMQDIGLTYTGPFRALKSIKRKMNISLATLEKPHVLDTCELPVRPALLDVCFQAAFAAFAAPGDGALWTAFLPKRIGRLRFNLAICEVQPEQQTMLDIDAYVTKFDPTTSLEQANFSGDIEVFNSKGEMEIQIEGINVVSFAASNKSEDRELYLHTLWDMEASSGLAMEVDSTEEADDQLLAGTCERIAGFFSCGRKYSRKFKKQDTHEDIDRLVQMSPYRTTLEFIRNCGEHLPAIGSSLLPSVIQECQDILRFNQRVGRFAKQIAHRYPRMKVLEIGEGQGTTASSVLRALGSAFTSYTYTYVDDSPFNHLRELFKDLYGKISFEQLDIAKDIAEQGFTANAHDLVVVSRNLTTSDDALETSLKNINLLMKPGGYLLVLGLSGELLKQKFMRCVIPSPKLHIQPSPEKWDDLMKGSGFSGIMHHIEEDFGTAKLSLMVSQAVDPYIDMLQYPLQSLPLANFAGQVLIVGGKTHETKKISQKLVEVLADCSCTVILAESFECVDPQILQSIKAAVILADLDEPIIATMNEDKLTKMQAVFSPNRFVLWLTKGSRADDPYHNASVGLGRCIKAETPQLTLQFLDLDTSEGAEDHVAEAFIRLAIADSSDLADHLWTTEHELAIENGRLLIPRVLPLEIINDRLNSTRRVITRDADTSKSVIEVSASDSAIITARTICRVDQIRKVKGHTTVQVHYSSLSAIRIMNNTHLHVCLGSFGGGKFIALSNSNASFSRVPFSCMSAVPTDIEDDEMFLGLVMRFLIAQGIADDHSSGPLIIFEPDELMAFSLAATATTDRVLCLTTDLREAKFGLSWDFVHPQASERALRSHIPRESAMFADFSSANGNFSSLLANIMPPSCVSHSKEFFVRPACTGDLETRPEMLHAALDNAIFSSAQAVFSKTIPESRQTVTSIQDVLGQSSRSDLTIIDWATKRIVPEIQKHVDAATLLSNSKTYLLVGLTGELGQSLCKLMVTNGVRYVVVASRNPQKESKWRDELQAMGATISIESVDVADLKDVLRLRDELARTMPPIAGVVNGAMVLSDGIFADMSLESLQKVLRPKVQGSKNLDEAFSGHELDFFMMFSSLTAVAGNRGQGNYAAANMYMAGLAAQRRKRGLVASVLDIGMLTGIGYINRQEGAEIYNNLRKQGYRPISEQDIHHMFIEGILAGRTTSAEGPQLTTGLQRFSLSDKKPLHWHFNPKFSHHTFDSGDLQTGSAVATESVKKQLRGTKSPEEAAETLKRCFSAQLELMLQLPPNTINKDIPIIELGVDSLLAVEIRSWFLKEIEKDMPVLKVLGGSSLSELCDEIAVDVAADNANFTHSMTDTVAESEGSTESGSLSNTEASDYNNVLTPLSTVEPKESDLSEKIEKMSYNQARMYFPFLLLEDKTAYNCTTSYKLKGSLDIIRFEKALGQVIQRHQVFRTSFYADPSTGEPMQIVSPFSSFVLKKVSPANETEDLKRETDEIATHHYDLEVGDVFIATLLTHEPKLHTIVFGYHHIMIDAVSWQIFLQDVEKFYSEPNLKPPATTQYIDFSVKQRAVIESKSGLERRNYWKSEYPDLPEALPLFPFANVNTRKSLTRYEIKDYFVLLDPKLVSNIKRASTDAKTTTFHFYLSVLQVLLHRFLDIDDMCIGITDANRTDMAFMQTVGLLLDSLPLRFKIKEEDIFLDRLQSTRNKVYSALGNSGIPLDTILDDLNVTTTANVLPLFQILVNYRMGALKQKTMGDVQLDYLAYEDAKHPFDFILSIDEDEGAGGLSLSMQEYLYDKEGGDLFLETYVHLLEAFSSDPSMRINECQLFDQRQKDSAIVLGIGSENSLKWPEETLSLRVDVMVQMNPGDLAIKEHFGTSMTYRQMSERCNSIAVALKSMGAEKGTRVALFCEPCADAVCALLAILRLGAIYTPLDVRNSTERLGTIVTESNAKIVIYHSLTKDRLRDLSLSHHGLLDISILASTAASTVVNQSRGSDPAFIMWTSGSTGKPKGIVLSHTNFLTHIMSATEAMGLGKEKILQQSAFGYDASLAQIFYALANGGSIVMSSNRREMGEIAALMLQENITLTLCAPSEYSVLFQYGGLTLARCHAWRVAMCGGEAFPAHVKVGFRNLQLPTLRVFNAYGPTEISVASNIGEVEYKIELDDNSKIPIGRPMPNYAVYVLDETSQPVPLGWVGEICVAGPAVSSGYVSNGDLTKLKFIPDRISQTRSQGVSTGWETIYRTSDKGRMLSDGSIVYLGRMDGDAQIKLRGIRIELDDIANTMIKCSENILANVAVGVRGEINQYLVAYVVFAAGKTPKNPSRYLARLILDLPLPVYMQPAVAIPVDRFPVTASGKLDLKTLSALPLPDRNSSEDASAQLSDIEIRLKAIWEDILSNIGLEVTKSSNFFSLGGNSLLLLRAQAEIAKEFNINISLPELFQASTLESLALKIQDRQPTEEGFVVVENPSSVPGIDWEAETAPLNLPTCIPNTPHERPLTVILTGATGFLGRALFRELESSDDILHIHCVAVRQKALSIKSNKATLHYGDLALPLLGMTEEEARLVFEDADVIIHNGADVSFMKTFESLRLPNVTSTKELVRSTVHRGIPFHFISTAGVAHLSGRDAFDEVSVAPYSPSRDGTDGYVASKWASERYLERVSEQLGLQVWIHRPASITGEGAPPMDIMQNVIKFSQNLRAVPDLAGWNGFFDFIDVRTVARDIVDSVLVSMQTKEQFVDYIHHSGELVISVQDIKNYLEKTTGYKFRVLPMKDWTEEAMKIGLHELVAAYLNTVGISGHLPMMPRLRRRLSFPRRQYSSH